MDRALVEVFDFADAEDDAAASLDTDTDAVAVLLVAFGGGGRLSFRLTFPPAGAGELDFETDNFRS